MKVRSAIFIFLMLVWANISYACEEIKLSGVEVGRASSMPGQDFCKNFYIVFPLKTEELTFSRATLFSKYNDHELSFALDSSYSDQTENRGRVYPCLSDLAMLNSRVEIEYGDWIPANEDSQCKGKVVIDDLRSFDKPSKIVLEDDRDLKKLHECKLLDDPVFYLSKSNRSLKSCDLFYISYQKEIQSADNQISLPELFVNANDEYGLAVQLETSYSGVHSGQGYSYFCIPENLLSKSKLIIDYTEVAVQGNYFGCKGRIMLDNLNRYLDEN